MANSNRKAVIEAIVAEITRDPDITLALHPLRADNTGTGYIIYTPRGGVDKPYHEGSTTTEPLTIQFDIYHETYQTCLDQFQVFIDKFNGKHLEISGIILERIEVIDIDDSQLDISGTSTLFRSAFDMRLFYN